MAQPAPTELLQRLEAHAARMERAGRASSLIVIAEIDEHDAQGKVLHRLRSRARIEQVGGRTVTRVEEATRDGRDDRAAAQRRADEQDREPPKQSPFAAAQQGNYRFTMIAPERLALAPAGTPRHADVMVGEALIDPLAGECISLAGRPAKMGPLVERADFRFDYQRLTPEGRMLSSMQLDYAGGLLFVRKQGVIRMRFEAGPR